MRQGIYIAIVVALQLLATLLIQLLVIRIIGVGPETDAYIAAQAVPSVLAAIITTALQSVWLPRLAVLSNDVSAWRYEQSIAQGQAGLLGGGIFLLVGLSMPLWLPLLFPGFGEQQQKSTLEFCFVLLLAVVFNSQSAVLTVALRARSRFLASEIIALLVTFLSLLAMYFALPLWGLSAAVWIALVRSIVVYGIQMSLANWPPLSFKRGWACKETWLLMRPLLFGTSIYKTGPWVDRYWASQAPTGAITTLSLAQTAMGALATILERIFCMPITPMLARYVEKGDYIGLQKIYRKVLLKVAISVLIIGLVLGVFRYEIIEAIAILLKIKIEQASEIWIICMLLIGYLYAAVSGVTLVSVFYALSDTKNPVYIGITGFVFGIFLKWKFFVEIGFYGLAVSASIYFLLNIVFFCVFLERKLIQLKAL